jgi:cation/acetate symporter
MANTLSHDLYYKIIDPKAEVKKRLMTSRILLLVIGAGGAAVASLKLTGILGAVAWAFCFAMSGLFVPLVLGVWWKRANRAGALAGMIVGLSMGWWYLLAVRNPEAWYGLAQPWLGLDDLRFGVVGVTASAIAMVVVTLLTPEPSGVRSSAWSTTCVSARRHDHSVEGLIGARRFEEPGRGNSSRLFACERSSCCANLRSDR